MYEYIFVMKDVAESVSNLVAGAVIGNLNNIAIATGNLQSGAEGLTDNLHNVAGNLQTNIHSAVNSAVNSAYCLFRQKTLQVQVCWKLSIVFAIGGILL